MMRNSSHLFALAIAFLAATIFSSTLAVPARAAEGAQRDAPCYDQFQNEIPCPEKTPRHRKTETPVPPTATPSPTPTDTPTSTPTASLTPTAAATETAGPPTPNPLAAPNAFVPPPPAPPPWTPLAQFPTWMFVGAGAWFVILIALIAGWLLSGRGINPGPPPSQAPRLGRKAWGAGTLLWLLIPIAFTFGQNLLPPGLLAMCGVDSFPDWVPTHLEVTKSDVVYVTVANIGPCPSPPINGWLYSAPSEEDARKGLWPSSELLKVPALPSGESVVLKQFIPYSYSSFVGGKVYAFWVNFFRGAREEDYYNDLLVVKP